MSAVRLPRIEKILSGFKRRNILVVGDLMLDKFIWGEVSRISPEAPIPVVEVESVSNMPGGAANVVNNICALGGKGHVCGVVGKDADGRELIRLLKDKGADVRATITSSSVQTIVKTRVIARHQHVVRIDQEHSIDANGGIKRRLLDLIREKIPDIDAVVLEDYGKGVLNDNLVREVVRLAEGKSVIVTADPKIDHELDFSGIGVLTPNSNEAYHFAGMSPKKGEKVEDVGRALRRKWGGISVVITLGDKGMCLFERNRKPRYIRTEAKEIFDVAGAGDTVIASLTMALASGADLQEAAVIANIAAGIVVQKSGVETASCGEIIEAARSEL